MGARVPLTLAFSSVLLALTAASCRQPLGNEPILVAVPTATISIVAPPSASTTAVDETLPDPLGHSRFDLEQLWTQWFANAYQPMFARPGDFPDAPLGISPDAPVFGAGVDGIYFYGRLQHFFEQQLGKDENSPHDDYAALEKVAGIPFRIGTVGSGSEHFGKYNPAMIDWALRNLVPAPEQRFGSWTFQRVYDRSFFRVVRLHAKAYIALRTEYDIAEQAQAYRLAMDQPNFEALSWLRQRYAELLADYYPLDEDGTMLTAPMAVGFWLRRHIDHTESALVAALGVVLRRYDKPFTRQNRQHMNLFARR